MALNQIPFNILRGRTVLAIKYETGVLIVADTLLQSQKGGKNHDKKRIFKINEIILLSGSGDSADLKHIIDEIEKLKFEHDRYGTTLTPLMLYSWLTKQFYFRHKIGNSLHVDVIVGGLEAGKPFLAYIRHDGFALEYTYVACDFTFGIDANVSYKNLLFEYINAEINKLSSHSVDGETSSLIRKTDALKIIIDGVKQMNKRFIHTNEAYLLGECDIVDENTCNIAIKPLCY